MEKNKDDALNPKSDFIKKKIFAYFTFTDPGAWTIAAVFMLLGEWYSSNTFPFFHSLISLFGIAFIARSASLLNNVFDKDLDIQSNKKKVWIFSYISSREMLFDSILLN